MAFGIKMAVVRFSISSISANAITSYLKDISDSCVTTFYIYTYICDPSKDICIKTKVILGNIDSTLKQNLFLKCTPIILNKQKRVVNTIFFFFFGYKKCLPSINLSPSGTLLNKTWKSWFRLSLANKRGATNAIDSVAAVIEKLASEPSVVASEPRLDCFSWCLRVFFDRCGNDLCVVRGRCSVASVPTSVEKLERRGCGNLGDERASCVEAYTAEGTGEGAREVACGFGLSAWSIGTMYTKYIYIYTKKKKKREKRKKGKEINK